MSNPKNIKQVLEETFKESTIYQAGKQSFHLQTSRPITNHEIGVLYDLTQFHNIQIGIAGAYIDLQINHL